MFRMIDMAGVFIGAMAALLLILTGAVDRWFGFDVSERRHEQLRAEFLARFPNG